MAFRTTRAARALTFAALTCGAVACAATAACAETPEEFYKGKTVTFYVGLSPGGGYDVNARLTARFIGKYIPGHPEVVVKNMPGSGSITMANYVVNIPPKDGLSIGAPQRGIPFEPLLADDSHAKFDPLKLNWIGSTNADTSVAVATTKSGVKTWEDLLRRELIVAGTGVGTESVVVPYVLRNLLGLQFKVIAGYPGGSQMNIAMERGEVDGRGTLTWTSLKPHYKEWVEGGKIKILFQMGLRKHPDLMDVPLVIDLAKDEDTKRLLKIEFTGFEMGRPYFVADGVPADRVKALRDAFNAAMKDKDLLAEAEKLKLEINPSTGEEMTEMVKEAYGTAPKQIARLKEASKNQPDLKVLKAAEVDPKPDPKSDPKSDSKPESTPKAH